MLPLDSLRNTRRLIVHGNCPDGRASAVILHAALPDAEIIELAHGSAEHKTLQPAGDILFCDFVPWTPPFKDPKVPTADELIAWEAAIRPWVDSGAIVLDHHRGAEELVKRFGERGVFADEVKEPGVSGAVLAMREVFVPMAHERMLPMHDARDLAYIVGIRDTWQRSSPEWQRACEVSEVLRFLPLDECLKRGAAGIMATADDIGPLLWTKKQKTSQEAAKTAVRTTIACRRVAIISSVNLTSDVADVLGSEVDVVAGFDYMHSAEGVDLVWSLRGRNGTDVRVIAQANGGNGHTAAAGFKVPVDISISAPGWNISPYAIADIVLARGLP